MAEGSRGAAPAPPDSHRRFFGLVLLGWALYTAVWTIISVLRLGAFRASVYDLGVFAQAGWRTYSANLTSFQLFTTMLNQGGSVFLSPIVLGGYDVILLVQSAALGLGGPLLFLIARRYGFGPRTSAAIGGSYLIYFVLAGVNFTDAHYEAFLIPFFLGAFLLYLQSRFVASLVLFLLAGLLQYPMALYPTIFAVLLAAPFGASFLLRRISRRAPTPSGGPEDRPSIVRRALSAIRSWRYGPSAPITPKWYAAALLVGAGGILVGGFLTNRLFYPLNDAVSLAHASSISVGSGLSRKLLTFLLLFGPLAFIPFASPRWVLFCVPYLGLMFLTTYQAYYFPGVITSWYTCLIIPFLFLGLVDGLDKIQRRSTWVHWIDGRLRAGRQSAATGGSEPVSARSERARRLYRSLVAKRNLTPPGVLATVVLVLLVIFAMFYTPYGPFNGGTTSNFHMGAIWGANQTLYDHFLKLAGLIPSSASSVILQDNMPQLLPRPLEPGSVSPLVPGPFGQVAWNLTWPNPNGSWTPINPDYVIGNPTPLLYSFFSAEGSYPFNTSMEQILTNLYGTGEYGILGEADGMWLIGHYYRGPLEYYVPYAQTFHPSDFTAWGGANGANGCGGSCLVERNLTNGQSAWYGPYTYLAPGAYRVSFELAVQGWAPSNNLTIDVATNFSGTVLGSTTLTGATLSGSPNPFTVTLTVVVSKGVGNLEFRGVDAHFQGSVTLYRVHVVEVGPPPAVFPV